MKGRIGIHKGTQHTTERALSFTIDYWWRPHDRTAPVPNHREHTFQKLRITRLMCVPASISGSDPFGLAL